MPTEPRPGPRQRGRSVLVACIAATLLLGGCASGGGSEDDPAAPAASSPSAGADDAAAGTSSGTSGATDRSGTSSEPGKSGKSGGSDKTTGSGAEETPDSGSTPDNGGGSDPSGTVLEVPVAAAPTVDSLGELLGDADRPLVTAPLPRAASAQGRLVGGFPALLRPAAASQVDSSSVSPADDRLQVALVGSTTLSPAKVLLDYRTRLGRRGLLEQPTPATAAGSQAAALRRGRSVVTITVTRQGSRTSYSVVASLHTGRE